jgi:hypothetical protein
MIVPHQVVTSLQYAQIAPPASFIAIRVKSMSHNPTQVNNEQPEWLPVGYLEGIYPVSCMDF